MYSRCLWICSNCTSNCDFNHLVRSNSQHVTKMVSRCLYHANHLREIEHLRIIALEENSSLNEPVSASQVNHLPSSCRWFGRSPTSLPKGLFQVGQEHKSFAVIRLGLSPFHQYILEIKGWFTEKSHNWKGTSVLEWMNEFKPKLHSWNQMKVCHEITAWILETSICFVRHVNFPGRIFQFLPQPTGLIRAT